MINADSRSLAVGYPERMHYCFSATNLNLQYIWKGGFVDAGRTWSGRGKGEFSIPVGKPLHNIGSGPAFNLLKSMDAPWSEDISDDLKLDFKGYENDEKGRPTLNYTVNNMNVTDYFLPNKESKSLTRTLIFKRKKSNALSKQCVFRLLAERPSKGTKKKSYITKEGLEVTVLSSTRPRLVRKDDVILPLDAKDETQKIVIKYTFNQ